MHLQTEDVATPSVLPTPGSRALASGIRSRLRAQLVPRGGLHTVRRRALRAEHPRVGGENNRIRASMTRTPASMPCSVTTRPHSRTAAGRRHPRPPTDFAASCGRGARVCGRVHALQEQVEAGGELITVVVVAQVGRSARRPGGRRAGPAGAPARTHRGRVRTSRCATTASRRRRCPSPAAGRTGRTCRISRIAAMRTSSVSAAGRRRTYRALSSPQHLPFPAHPQGAQSLWGVVFGSSRVRGRSDSSSPSVRSAWSGAPLLHATGGVGAVIVCGSSEPGWTLGWDPGVWDVCASSLEFVMEVRVPIVHIRMP